MLVLRASVDAAGSGEPVMSNPRPGSDRELELRIRPPGWCDVGPIRELFDRLSPRSRYLRFFSPMPRLPQPWLTSLACTDRRRLALLAEVNTVDGYEVVAVGNYSATDDQTVEVGLVVGDDWQQQGIGTALARELLQAASARGFDRFVAHVLGENVAVRRLLKHVAIMSTKTQHGVSEVRFVFNDATHSENAAR